MSLVRAGCQTGFWMRALTDGDINAMAIFQIAASEDSIFKAAVLGIPFLANQFEGPLVIAQHIAAEQQCNPVHADVTERILASWREIWADGAKAGNAIKGHRFFTVEMPFFLVFVLRECQTIGEFPKVLSEIRDSKEAKAFRAWTTHMNEEVDLPRFLSAYREADTLAQRLLKQGRGSALDTTLQVGLSPSLTLPVEAIKDKIEGFRKPHLRFIRRLLSAAAQSGRAGSCVSRVFGVSERMATEAISMLDSSQE